MCKNQVYYFLQKNVQNKISTLSHQIFIQTPPVILCLCILEISLEPELKKTRLGDELVQLTSWVVYHKTHIN